MQAAESMHRYGVLLVWDPEVREKDNAAFIDMMERYYEQSDGVTDARPELSYQASSVSHCYRNNCGTLWV